MKIFVTDPDGKEHALDAVIDWRVMEIIREAGLPMMAQCGGSCACSTCHVYVHPDWVGKLPEPNEEEVGMLDSAFEVKENSRLSCQLIFSEALDGLKLIIAPGSY